MNLEQFLYVLASYVVVGSIALVVIKPFLDPIVSEMWRGILWSETPDDINDKIKAGMSTFQKVCLKVFLTLFMPHFICYSLFVGWNHFRS